MNALSKISTATADQSMLATWSQPLLELEQVPVEACYAVIAEIKATLATKTSFDEAKRLAFALVSSYPQKKTKEIDAFIIGLATEIKDYPAFAIKEAIRQLRRYQKFLPAIAEVIEECEWQINKLESLQKYAYREIDRPEREARARRRQENDKQRREQLARKEDRKNEKRWRRRLAEIAAKIEKVYSIGVWELPRLNPGIFTYMQIIKIADFSHSKTNERSHFNVFLDDLSLGIPYAYVRYRRVMLIDKILDYAEWGERETNWLWVKQMADIVYESEGSARGSLDDLYSGSGSKPKRGNPTIHRPEAYSAIGRALGGRRCHDVARNEGPDQDPTPEPHRPFAFMSYDDVF